MMLSRSVHKHAIFIISIITTSIVVGSKNFSIFQSDDGALYITLVKQSFIWTTAIKSLTTNFFQGDGGVFLTMNVWVNPVFIVYKFLSGNDVVFAVNAITFFAMCIFLYFLSLSFGLPRLPASIAAQCVAVIACTPAGNILGFASRVISLNSNFAFTGGILLFVIAIIHYSSNKSKTTAALLGLAVGAILIYGVICDPLWFIVMAVTVAPFLICYAIAAIIIGNCTSLIITASVSLSIFAIPATYLYGLIGYSARNVFSSEMGFEEDRSFQVIALYTSTYGAIIYILSALGCCLLIYFGGRSSRKIGWAGLGQISFIAAITALYGLSNTNWALLPLPLYFEVAAVHLSIIAGCVGWYRIIRDYAARTSGEGILPAPVSKMIWAATFVPALVMLKPSSQPMPPVPGALPTTLPGELLSTLDPLRIQPGQPFRGATASMIGFNSGELAVSRPFSNAKIAQLETLWRQGIPTLEEYSQLVTSPSYLVVSRILAGRGDNHMRNLLIPRRINPALMKALGVRMVISNTPLSEGVPIGHFTDERGQDFYIFEWPDYNYGNYSPTNIIPVNSASEAISRMAEGDMDYRNNVIVQNGDIDATPLTKATFSEIVFNADSKIDLAAGSTGTSIVIIPIQFSRCLYVDGDDVYLFRANLMETGILFKGKIQVRITNRFDIFHPACRLRDISDMKRLDITALRREREAKGPSPTGERK